MLSGALIFCAWITHATAAQKGGLNDRSTRAVKLGAVPNWTPTYNMSLSTFIMPVSHGKARPTWIPIAAPKAAVQQQLLQPK
jgi:hypothetical protein